MLAPIECGDLFNATMQISASLSEHSVLRRHDRNNAQNAKRGAHLDDPIDARRRVNVSRGRALAI